MKISTEHKKYIKTTCGIGFGISTLGWVAYETWRTYKILTSLVNTSVLEYEKKTPQFIYIKHQIYRESMQQLLRDQEKYVILEKIFQPFSKWWKTIKHSLAFRLLRMAQDGNHQDRVKAIHQLAQIKHLKDWDFRHLAQICDARTAVALANSDCDQRWFLLPLKYGLHKPLDEILQSIKTLLEQLLPNKCVEYILKTTFSHEDDKEPAEGDAAPYGYVLSQQELDQLRHCLDALLHITTDEEMCKKIVANRGLETLLEIEKLDRIHSDIKISLCRIVANITAYANNSYDYFATGWVGILSKWSHDIDIRLQVTSSMALGNLDTDDPNHCIFGPKVYQLYPMKRQKVAPKLDIVFVHGLLGGVFITWRQKDREAKEVSLSSKKELVIPNSRDKIRRSIAKIKNIKQGIKNLPKKNSAPASSPSSLSEEETLIGTGDDLVINMKKLQEKPKISISDPDTKEIFTELHQDDLGSDWSVVFPDIPIKSNEEASSDELIVSGEHWQNEDPDSYTYCWPMDWLPDDFPNIRVIGLNYESALSQWTATSGCPCEQDKGKLQTRAAEFLQRLAAAQLGHNRPVVWVGHSMGGLLIKYILVQGLQQPTTECQQIAKNTAGVLFLGTPHRGSSIAKLKQHTTAILWPSVEVLELEQNAKPLLELHEKFIHLLTKTKYPMEIVSITEGRPTILTSLKVPFRIVNDESAHISYGDFYMTKDDHLGISKPMCRHSFFYQRLLKMIGNSMRHPDKEKVEDTDESVEEQTRILYRKLFDYL